MKKVIITDKLNEDVVELFKTNSIDVDYKPGISAEDLKSIIHNYNALIVRSQTKVTEEIISSGKNLEIIGRAGTGVDNIDLPAATRRGIVVMNTPGGNTISAAEHTIAMLLSLCRSIPQANATMREGKWDRKNFYGAELFGKTVGVVGLGKIGREVAKRLKAFEMNVLGFDPVLSETAAEELGIKLVTVEEIIKESDFITVHVPLNENTKDLISFEQLNKLKKGTRIINCARGGIINEDAVLEGIEKGIIAGAAFDVFEVEPPQNKKLIEHPKIITTPHLGASTEEAQEKVSYQICNQIIDYFNNKNIIGTVNAVSIQYLNDSAVKPYILLAEKIGQFISQTVNNPVNEFKIKYNGSNLDNYSDILTSALLKGYFEKRVDEPVNFINAKIFSEDSGIIITESTSGKDKIYQTLISVEAISKNNKHAISGTLGLNAEIRIVSLDGYNIDLIPDGKMIIYHNIDKPGVLAKVSKCLADENINIAGVFLGRKNKGLQALTVMKIDDDINSGAIKNIENLSEIKRVICVSF